MAENTRPPVIAIMGHVDHGKTSLLDAIRKSKVAAGEAGGITQHIGAYQIEYNGRKLTFLDTPGHAAFSKMRSRGAQVTDIVVLVVAADDGVKPQTIESIQHIRASGVDYIVAINKIDAPGANVINVKTQLAEHEVFVEGFGGNVSVVEVSAKTGQGINDLLELLQLTADVQDLKNDPTAAFKGVVIESGKDAKTGVYATILVQEGTLLVRDDVYVEGRKERVRVMTDENGKQVKEALPASAVRVLGFSEVPAVGAIVASTVEATKTGMTPGVVEPTDRTTGVLKLILKADVVGSEEALLGSMPVDVEVIASGVGDISESDVLMAQTTGARIVGFNVRATKSVQELAEQHGVKLKSYRIIYELLEDLDKAIFVILHPDMNEEEVGVAEIVAEFNMRGERIAGCKVISGEIKRGPTILYHLKRDDQVVVNPRIRTMKQGKQDVDSVKAPAECGIVFRGNVSFKIGDTLVCYIIKEV